MLLLLLLFTYLRVLLDNSKTGSPVVIERVLLQPFHMLLALERNLCGWYKHVPTLSVNLTMGELAVSCLTNLNLFGPLWVVLG